MSVAKTGFPRISVVIPNHNHGACLGTAMESVCTQEPPPFELFVFDDCSTDNSLEVIDSFARRFSFVRLLRYPQKSADWVIAWCANLERLSGDYVLSLGADDYIYPGLLEAAGRMMARHPECGVFFPDWHRRDSHGHIIREMRSGVDSPRYLEGAALTEQICKFDIFESGVGSVVRKDLLLWINRNGAAGMGPWYDSIGAPIMAMKHGACYFPSFLASVHIAWTPEKLNYAKRIFHDPARAVEHFQHVKAFLDAREIRAVVPAEVLEVLETKATSDLPGGGRRFWRRIMDRAHALIANQCYAQADQWLRGVVRVFPREAEAYFALGIVQHKLGRLAEEELAFRRAVKLDPANAAARSNWGVCRQRQGFTADAIVAYQRAIEIDPGFAGAYANLGNLLSGEGRWEDALVPLQRLVQLRPLAAAGFVSLGNAYLALGRKAEALAAHRRAWELDPQSAAPVGHVEISHARSRTP